MVLFTLVFLPLYLVFEMAYDNHFPFKYLIISHF